MTTTIQTKVDGTTYNLLEVNKNTQLEGTENLIFVSSGNITLASKNVSTENIIIRNISSSTIQIVACVGEKIKNNRGLFLEAGKTIRLVNNKNQWLIKSIEDNANWIIDKYVIDKLNAVIPESFPYEKLVIDPSGIKSFRIYVKPTGNNNNNGLTWETAKQDINGALADLPYDMKGYSANILIHSGTYRDVKSIGSINNGSIYFVWVGTYVNNETGSSANWIRNGSVAPIKDNEPVIITSTIGKSFEIQGNNLMISFYSFNMDKAWDVADGYYFDRFVFSSTGNPDALLWFSGSNIWFNIKGGVQFDFANCSTGVMFGLCIKDWAKNLKGEISAMSSTEGVNVSACKDSGVWRGLIFIQGASASFQILSWNNHKYHPSYAPPNTNHFNFVGIHNIFSEPLTEFSYYGLADFSDSYYSSGNLVGGTKGKFNLHERFGGVLKFKENIMGINQFLSNERLVIVETVANNTKTYLSKNLYDDGTHLYYKTVQID